MPVTERFVTAKRAELIILTRRLVRAIEQGRLNQPDNPLMIGVNGAYRSGKKIFADAARASKSVFDGKPAMTGVMEYDEYWHGSHGTEEREIHYINLAWAGEGYSNQDLRPCPTRVETFLALRRHGGITILQNPEDSCPERLGITITVGRDSWIKGGISLSAEQTLLLDDEEYIERIRTLQKDHPCWTRYVEVQVKDAELQASPRLGDALAAFARACRENYHREEPGRTLRNKTAQTPTPAFG